MAGDQFDKDFGYLMPFIDKVTAAAESHPDERTRNELGSLLNGEKARWSRIQTLISGEAEEGELIISNPQPAAASSVPRNDTNQAASESSSRIKTSFTVGSLRPRSS